ncbi:glycosyltransferase family protein [Leptothoe spongobia]|uniref:Glycosyltransferase n=1 Tax=Leptothoe spongobia TAU-MAC 1115 TaxID=1967444 RepID=A0A947GMG2_9CYAN|nr:glycosyltransferase [Leptothoe spongobia]MBT9315521.1 glycosyltransferase [Leptothoe spongobia TAU-MAC 1115]
MKLMVYSHDAFGLGNIRRMLTICEYLLRTLPNVSILVVSGSPALHTLRLPEGLDYIKLPCLGRDPSGQLEARYLKSMPETLVRLRSHLILTAAAHFQPDVLLIDKKPQGLRNELKETLGYLSRNRPKTKRVLLLRDILDVPAATIQQWSNHNYYQLTQEHYDQVWVVGTPEIFNLPDEYNFPLPLRRKVKFCGYLSRGCGRIPRPVLRQQLGVPSDERLVVVTPGGGGDGQQLIKTYLESVRQQTAASKPGHKTVIISGPEMPAAQRQQFQAQVDTYATIRLLEFSDDLISYLNAADAVVAMAGYNTTCEILSLRKPAVVIPRIRPVQEQWMRAKRFADRGLLYAIHPQQLTPQALSHALHQALTSRPYAINSFRLDGLPRIAQLMQALIPSYTASRNLAELPCAL